MGIFSRSLVEELALHNFLIVIS